MTDIGITAPAEAFAPDREARPRRAWLAAVAALLLPPLGHVYAGRARRGIALQAAAIVAAAILLRLSLAMPVRGLRILCLALLPVPTLLMVADAARTARRAPVPFVPRRYNRAWVYVAGAIAAWVVGQLAYATLLGNVAHAWKIVSAGMAPTLQRGDFVLFSPRGAVHRGDVIAYRSADGTVLHRVVGIPGDTLEMRDGVLFRGGRRVSEPYVVDFGGHEQKAPEMEWQRAAYAGAHREAYVPTFGSWGPLAVPADRYFVLGDNRSSSYDSRFTGFVRRGDVAGHARWIYLSIDPGGGVRWDRIGLSVR
jgi:signal peptidase I